MDEFKEAFIGLEDSRSICILLEFDYCIIYNIMSSVCMVVVFLLYAIGWILFTRVIQNNYLYDNLEIMKSV